MRPINHTYETELDFAELKSCISKAIDLSRQNSPTWKNLRDCYEEKELNIVAQATQNSLSLLWNDLVSLYSEKAIISANLPTVFTALDFVKKTAKPQACQIYRDHFFNSVKQSNGSLKYSLSDFFSKILQKGGMAIARQADCEIRDFNPGRCPPSTQTALTLKILEKCSSEHFKAIESIGLRAVKAHHEYIRECLNQTQISVPPKNVSPTLVISLLGSTIVGFLVYSVYSRVCKGQPPRDE